MPEALREALNGAACLEVYSVSASKENVGSMTFIVTDMIPDGSDVSTLSMYRVGTDGNVTKLGTDVNDDGSVSFSADGLGTFVLASYVEPSDDGSDNTYLIVAAVVAVIIIAGLALCLRRRAVRRGHA